jgi:PAS domain S-box-containing protein
MSEQEALMLQPIEPQQSQQNPAGEPDSPQRNHLDPPEPADTTWLRVLDHLPHGVAVLDAADGTTLWINSALQTLLEEGTGTTHIVGLAPFEYLPGLQPEEWDEALEALPASNPSGPKAPAHRLQLVHYATRNIAYWEWSVLRLEDNNDGNLLVLTVQAISDRVLNERVLASAGRAADRARRRAEALMRLAQLVNVSLTTPDLLRAITHQAAAYFDAAHAAVLLLNPDGDTLEVGYAMGLDDVQPDRPTKLGLNNTVAGLAIATRQTQFLAEVDSLTIQTPMLNNGRAPAALISSPIWQDGHDYGVVEVYFPEPREVADNAQAMLAAFADQTAIALHKAALYEELAAQRRQLQSIVENAPVSIIYFDVDGIALSVNEEAARKYGRTVDTMVAHSYEEFLTDVPAGLFGRAISGTPFHASHHVYNSPSEGQIVCDLSLRPVRDGSASVVGLLLLSFEVTELVKARQEADQARQTAEIALAQVQATQSQMVQMEKMRAIGELASGVAHDFNNALQAILGYTELAEESLDSPKELAEQLEVIRKSAEDASATVERLQLFAKQRVTAHGKPTDVNEIVKDVVSMTKPRWRDAAQKQGRIYHVSIDLQPVERIMAEPSGLREVLVNLIHNALNAMPDGGNLVLSTRQHGNNQVEICVEDTGTGMTPEVAARIFDPFFTTRGVEGTGLGLAVSWTIVQRHGGVIELDTRPGKGTRFILRFPAGSGNLVATVSPPIAPMPPRVGGIRVLVVDDEPFVASVLTTILTRHGYRVVAVHSAKSAIECLEEEGDDVYGVVLTDHGMPGMTGLELVAEIKQHRPTLPVLLLTGWGDTILDTHIADVLPDAVLGKPINQADLLDAIARVSTPKMSAADH